MILDQGLRCFRKLFEEKNQFSWVNVCLLEVVLDLVWVAIVQQLPSSIQVKPLQTQHVVIHLLSPGIEDVSCLLDHSSKEQAIYLVLKVYFSHDPYLCLNGVLRFICVMGYQGKLHPFRGIDSD